MKIYWYKWSIFKIYESLQKQKKFCFWDPKKGKNFLERKNFTPKRGKIFLRGRRLIGAFKCDVKSALKDQFICANRSFPLKSLKKLPTRFLCYKNKLILKTNAVLINFQAVYLKKQTQIIFPLIQHNVHCNVHAVH